MATGWLALRDAEAGKFFHDFPAIGAACLPTLEGSPPSGACKKRFSRGTGADWRSSQIEPALDAIQPSIDVCRRVSVLLLQPRESQHLRRSDARILRYSIRLFLSILPFAVSIVAWAATYSPL